MSEVAKTRRRRLPTRSRPYLLPFGFSENVPVFIPALVGHWYAPVICVCSKLDDHLLGVASPLPFTLPRRPRAVRRDVRRSATRRFLEPDVLGDEEECLLRDHLLAVHPNTVQPATLGVLLGQFVTGPSSPGA